MESGSPGHMARLRLIAWVGVSLMVAAAVGSRGTGGLAAERPQQAVFSTRTDLVLAHATVLNPQGQIVKGLTSADFVIKDNGAVVEEAVVMPDTVPLAVGIVMNRAMLYYRETQIGSLGRYEGYGAVFTEIDSITAALGPEDVLGLSNAWSRKQMDLSRMAVEARRGNLGDIPSAATPQAVFALERSSWDLLAEAAEALAQWPGRKAILFVAGSEEWERAQLYRESFNPRFPLNDIARRPQPEPTVARSDVERTLERLGVLLQVVRYDYGLDTDIDRIAKTAGGVTYKLGIREQLAGHVNAIADGLRGSYFLGFKPARLDGKVHKLEIRSTRSDLKVTGRTQVLRADR